jgi:hypothetical protein
MPVTKKTKMTKTAESTPEVVATPAAAVETPIVMEGGAKKQKKNTKAKVEQAAAVVEAEPEAKKAKGKKAATKEAAPVAKKAKATKKAAVKEEKESEQKESKEEEEGEHEDPKTRSFKVQLPGEEDYTGRFTGLTPYQAANKALSKYFRNQENVNLSENNQVLFSIKESTRGSKRNVYNYKGSRVKLDTAITYTIKSVDGTERVITKQYKNQLIKVKKNATNEANAPVLA